MRSSVDFWYLRISRRATVPGRYLCGFFCCPFCPCCDAGSFLPLVFVALTTPFVCLDGVFAWGSLRGALPLPGSSGWCLNHSSLSLLGKGGGLPAFLCALTWFMSGAWLSVYWRIVSHVQCNCPAQAASNTLFIAYQLWYRVQLRPSVHFVLVIMYFEW